MLASRAAQGLCGGLAAFAIGSATVPGFDTFEYSRAGEMFMAMAILDVDVVDYVCKPV